MAKFKQVKQNFLERKVCEFWTNMVKNADEEVRDSDFFAIIANALPHDKVVGLVQAAFEDGELDEMAEARFRRARLDFDDCAAEILTCLWNNRKYTRKTKLVLQSISEIFMKNVGKPNARETFRKRVDDLQRVLKLTDLEREILLFAYIKRECGFDYPRRIDNSEKPIYFAMALDKSHAEILSALDPAGKLRKYDILDEDWDFNSRAFGPFLCGTTKDPIESHFYGRLETKPLPWEFFGSLANNHGRILKRMLAARKGRLNILLYGAPGTGKTSFARTLAAEMGLKPYEIHHFDDDRRDIGGRGRLAAIHVCNDQVDPDDSIMVIDEADKLLRGNASMSSLFGGGMRNSTEKGVVNAILDEIRMPAIWISNAPAEFMDESVRRRFDYSVRFDKLCAAQREAIWRNCVASLGLGGLIDDKSIPDMATKYIVSAGGISMVLENLKRINPPKEEAEQVVDTLMRSHCQLMGTRGEGQFLPVKEYSLEGLNVTSKIPLAKIETAVRRYSDAIGTAEGDNLPRMNILLHGVPGSGKTEWVKHLGKVLGRRVIVKMGSDILGMYVGESEKNIRNAFLEAEAENAILFFDEVDSLLQDRRGAHRSWEVSQVNELLHDIEESHTIVICATNFLESLDQAVLRRFNFKIEFGPLKDEGKKIFFQKVFGTQLTEDEERELLSIQELTPGDFRSVKESLRYLGDDATNAERLAGLREEVRLKPSVARTRVGF